MLAHTAEGMFITNDPAPFGGSVASPVWLSVTGLPEVQAIKIVGVLNRPKPAPPKPAPNAMREALDDLLQGAMHAEANARAASGQDKLVWIAHARKTREAVAVISIALSAPVPSPDGTQNALGWLLDAIKSEIPAASATPLLRRRFAGAEKVLLASVSATGAAEPDAVRDALKEITKAYVDAPGWASPTTTAALVWKMYSIARDALLSAPTPGLSITQMERAAKACRDKYCELMSGEKAWADLTTDERSIAMVSLSAAFSAVSVAPAVGVTREADADGLEEIIADLRRDKLRLVDGIKEAADLLAERSHGNPARSASHNARLALAAKREVRTAVDAILNENTQDDRCIACNVPFVEGDMVS